MVKNKSSRVNALSYSYYIDRGKIFEVENDGKKIPMDLFGDSIRFLVENQKNYDIFLSTHQRKLEWLKQNHPELML